MRIIERVMNEAMCMSYTSQMTWFHTLEQTCDIALAAFCTCADLAPRGRDMYEHLRVPNCTDVSRNLSWDGKYP